MRVNHSKSNHKPGSKSTGLGSVVLGMAALGLACMVATIGLLQHVGELGPKVGDIVSFEPQESFPRDMRARVDATPVSARTGGTCVLDVRTMHANGGSLVIESRQPGATPGFRVHWAGGRSSDGGTNCGVSADLLLGQDDIEVLAMAAGGFGVAANKSAFSSLWRSPAAVQ
jgi:hypothetical protein